MHLFFRFRTKQQIQHNQQEKQSDDQTDPEYAGCKEGCKLEDHKGNHIGEYTLISDSEDRPFRIVHFTLDRTDRGKAWCAQQIEYQERVCCCNREACCQRSPDF